MTSPTTLFAPPRAGSVWADTIFQCEYDPIDVLRTLYDVKTKGAQIVPFNLFRTQRLYTDRLGFRNVTVKPRQVGISTVNLGMIHAVCATTPNISALVVTHREDSTATMRDTIKNWTTWLNERHNFGLDIGKNNEDEYEFKNMNSRIYFGTAGGIGRSRTIQILLASELAHWSSKAPAEEYGGMVESVPERGLVFTESTPNGAAGPFHSVYKSPRNGYVKHFFPWFIEPSRSINLKGVKLHLTDEELTLKTLHKLTDDQIAWRRAKIGQLEAEGGLPFSQEYPEDDVTCFTAGTRSAFPVPRLVELIKQGQVAGRKDYEREELDAILGIKDPWDPGGKLTVWEGPRVGHRYLVTCDVGGGHPDGDLSVAIVRDTSRLNSHVATLAGHWTPEKFSDMSCRLATLYNTAYLSHERNGLGEGSVNQSINKNKYPNYHWELKISDSSGKKEWRPGFWIAANRRTSLLIAVKQEVVDALFLSFDVDLINQMTAAQLVRGKQAGGWADRIEIPSTVHDDHLMAYAQGTALASIVVFEAEQGSTRSVQVM